MANRVGRDIRFNTAIPRVEDVIAMLNSVYSLSVPGGLILLGVYACTRLFELPDPISDFLRWVPSAVLAVGILIGGRFRRSQLALGCVVLLLLDRS